MPGNEAFNGLLALRAITSPVAGDASEGQVVLIELLSNRQDVVRFSGRARYQDKDEALIVWSIVRMWVVYGAFRS